MDVRFSHTIVLYWHLPDVQLSIIWNRRPSAGLILFVSSNHSHFYVFKQITGNRLTVIHQKNIIEYDRLYTEELPELNRRNSALKRCFLTSALIAVFHIFTEFCRKIRLRVIVYDESIVQISG